MPKQIQTFVKLYTPRRESQGFVVFNKRMHLRRVRRTLVLVLFLTLLALPCDVLAKRNRTSSNEDYSWQNLSDLAKTKVVYENPRFVGTQVTRVNWQEVQFDHADLAQARMLKVNLRGARWFSSHAPSLQVESSNLSGLKAAGTDFSGAQFHHVKFVGANLSRTRFRSARFSRL